MISAKGENFWRENLERKIERVTNESHNRFGGEPKNWDPKHSLALDLKNLIIRVGKDRLTVPMGKNKRVV